ncbi:xanthine dehydrogenase family protein subunit M [Nocardioides sp. KR10-350]|uniref:FAD binding domain-containing protein n=1 Tax=Nocardioides cheoyonin TaxID=3156615 RepID=UPI0032B60258
MYPARFRYEAPPTLDEAIELLHDGAGEAKVLAGGQSLVPLLKLRFAAPELLVDINSLAELSYHRIEPDGTIRVGALCRHADLERSSDLAARQPTMAAAAPLIADPVVRTRGTLVGSLCHADPQGDWAAVATALGGRVVAQGPAGRREIPVTEFVTGPFQTTLAYDEVAVEAVMPAPAPGAEVRGGFLKLERRVGDFATAGAAVSVELAGGRVVRAGVALTGVGSRTLHAADAEAALVGTELDERAIEHAADLAAGIAEPSSDHRGSADYKRHVVHTFVTRILTRVAHQGPEQLQRSVA